MTGLPIFQIIRTTKFERSFSKLRKKYKGKSNQLDFIKFVDQLLRNLCSDPCPTQSEPYSLPSNISLPEGLTFRKLEFKMQPRLGGASACGRLIYLVNFEQNKVVLLWIYTHEEFRKRPDDQSLKKVIQEGLISRSDETDSF